MRILHVINSLKTGGAEKLLADTLPRYRAAGICAEVVVLSGNNQPFLELLRSRGVDVRCIGKGSVYNLLLIFKCIPLFRKYDIVHVHLFPSLYYIALAKMISFSGVKLVFTEHSTTNRRRKKFYWKVLDRLVYRAYEKIVCITPEVKQLLQNHLSIDANRFAIIGNGVDIDSIASQQPYDRKSFQPEFDGKFAIIQVSSFRPAKDQATVIRAIAELPEEVVLLLAGDGETRRECEQLAMSLNISERVHFLGIRMDIAKLLATADAVVLSSVYEGLSLASIEGMASGKPFIATNVPGLADVVGGAGILFPLGDHDALASEIEKLMNDSKYTSQIVQNCRERAKKYDISIMVQKHIALYKSLIK